MDWLASYLFRKLGEETRPREEEGRRKGKKKWGGRKEERRKEEKQQLQHPIRIVSGAGRGGGLRARQGHSERLLSFVSAASCGFVNGRQRSGAWHACRIPHHARQAHPACSAVPHTRSCQGVSDITGLAPNPCS